MDIIVATFSALLIRKLNINRLTRFGLCLMMGGGWLYVHLLQDFVQVMRKNWLIFPYNSAAIATIMKIYYFKGLADHADITLSWSPITIWFTYVHNLGHLIGSHADPSRSI